MELFDDLLKWHMITCIIHDYLTRTSIEIEKTLAIIETEEEGIKKRIEV